MEISEIEAILDEIVNRSHTWIRDNKVIANERVFHHMFTSLITIRYHERCVDPWEIPLLYPEHATSERFTWNQIDLDSISHTRRYAIGQGTAGNFDMVISDKKFSIIEWKGPNVFTRCDIARTMLKLF